MKIKITADSTCDLPADLLARYDIAIAPLTVLINDQPHHDGIDVVPDDLFHAVESGGSVKTAAVNVFEYTELFKGCLAEYDAVIHINIGSAFSACHLNACQAAKALGNVWVVDSASLNNGQALLAVDAAEMAEAGMAPQAIVEALEAEIPLVDGSFLLNQVDYLYRGGRCSGVEAVGAKLLHIHPTIELIGGRMTVGKKYRGSFDRCVEHYVLDRLENLDDIDLARAFIAHSPCTPGLVEHVQDWLTTRAGFQQIYPARAGSTICTHCGPNTLGVMFKRKTPKK